MAENKKKKSLVDQAMDVRRGLESFSKWMDNLNNPKPRRPALKQRPTNTPRSSNLRHPGTKPEARNMRLTNVYRFRANEIRRGRREPGGYDRPDTAWQYYNSPSAAPKAQKSYKAAKIKRSGLGPNG